MTGSYRTYVVLLDRSASMGLEDGNGFPGWTVPRKRSGTGLNRFRKRPGVALVAYDNRPLIIQPRTLIRREFLSRLDQVEVRPIAGDTAEALESAAMVAGLETPALILYAGDFGHWWRGRDRFAGGLIYLEKLNVALENPFNVGITSFQVRKTPLAQDSFDVHAQVLLNEAAKQGREVHLELFVGGIPSQVRDFELEPGYRENFEFRVRGAGGQILRMSIVAQGDSFPASTIR